MSPQHDPAPADVLMLLRAANPVPDEDALPGPDSAHARQTLAAVVADTSDTRGRRRRIVLLAAAALVLIAATTAVILTRPVTQVGSVGCYAQPDVDGRTAVVSTDGNSPIEACAELWRDGTFDTATQAPELTECVLPSGALGVFPAGSCDDLTTSDGSTDKSQRPLAPQREGLRERTARFEALQDDMVDALTDQDCIGPDDAARRAEAVLGDSPLSDTWTIATPRRFTDERPCAGLAFDQDTREVLLVPEAPPTPPDEAPLPEDEMEAFFAVRERILTRFHDEPCMTRDEALDHVREVLADSPLQHWTVDAPEPFSAQRPCAYTEPDFDDRAILVYPRPEQSRD